MQCKAALVLAVLLLVIITETSGSRLHSKRGRRIAPFLTMVNLIKKYKACLTRDIAHLKRDIVALKQDNTALKQNNTALKEDIAALKQDNAALKQDNADFKQDVAALQEQVTELQENVTRCLDSRCTQDPATPEPPLNISSGGATYVRWGRTSCPEEADLVYKGYAGGGNFRHKGSAADYLCLPEDPEYASNASVGVLAQVYGAKYKTPGSIFNNADQDVPCAVCRSSTRSSAIMVPARTFCHPGFHREYDGYLMAGYAYHPSASEYVCVDSSPENVPDGVRDQDSKLLYFAVSRCGSLKCPPYVEKRALTCVVCSK